MSRPDGGPAFPTEYASQDSEGNRCVRRTEGMSLRDWFAGQALGVWQVTEDDIKAIRAGAAPRHDLVAQFCWGLADAMLKARD